MTDSIDMLGLGKAMEIERGRGGKWEKGKGDAKWGKQG